MEDDLELKIIRNRLLQRLMTRSKRAKRKVQIKIITSPRCPYCPIAVRIANNIAKKYPEVEVREVSVVTPYGREKAIKHNIMGTPTILINDNVEFIGVPNPEELENKIIKYLEKS